MPVRTQLSYRDSDGEHPQLDAAFKLASFCVKVLSPAGVTISCHLDDLDVRMPILSIMPVMIVGHRCADGTATKGGMWPSDWGQAHQAPGDDGLI